jgi:hypothetical protein
MKETVKILTALLAALLVSLMLVTACTNPTNGEPGPAGPAGPSGPAGGAGEKGDDGDPGEDAPGLPSIPGGSGDPGYPVISPVAAIDVEELFIGDTNKVRILSASGGGSIYGIVPATKTLEIAGTVPIEGSQALTIGGTLHILETGSLTEGTSNGYEFAAGGGGKIKLDGGIFYSTTLTSSLGTVEFGLKGAIVLDPSDGASAVDAIFELGLASVAWPTTATLTAANLTDDLPHWTNTKTLKLSGAPTINVAVSVADMGNLDVTGTLTLGNKLTVSDAGNVTVTGSIVMNNVASELAGVIDVNGTITVNTSAPSAAIPDTVNLEDATIALAVNLEIEGTSVGTVTNSASVTLTLPASATITALTLGNALEIEGPTTALTVTTLRNTASSTLTLPAISVSVPNIVTLTSNDLTVAGTAASTTLTGITAVTGTGNLILGTNVKVGEAVIRLDTATSTLKTTGITLFTDTVGVPAQTAALAAKTDGTGTVDIDDGDLEITSALTTSFKPKIITTGDVVVKANAAFNNGLDSDTLANTGATGPVTLTLDGDSTFGDALTSVAAQTLTLEGDGGVTVGGIVTATGNLVVNNVGTVEFNDSSTGNIIATGKYLKVGTGASIAVGDLVFEEGTYTAGGDDSFIFGGASSVLKPATDPNEFLSLGDAQSGTYLKLGASGIIGTATFTATAGTVTLSGVGTGAIIVSDTSGVLALGATAELALGDGTVALGSGGILNLGTGGKVSGFDDDTNTTLVTTDIASTGLVGDFTGYTSGLSVTDTSGDLTAGVITGGATSYTGKSTAGGTLTAASAIGQ